MSIFKKDKDKDEDNDFSVVCPKCGSHKVTTASPTTFTTGFGNASMNMRNGVCSQNFTLYMCGNCGNSFKPND